MTEMLRNPMMLIDGDCGVCQAAGRVLEKLTKNALVIEPWQIQAALPAGVTEERLAEAVAFVGSRGDVFWGAAAIARALQQSPQHVVKLSGKVLTIFPVTALADVTYRIIARNRHKISRLLGVPACHIDPIKIAPLATEK